MSKFRCEMFGHFVYDESLSYHELLDVETRLIGDVQLLLEGQSAEHIDFSPLGDELMVQCAFDAYDEELFHSLSEGLQPCLPHAVEGRLLFVDKHMSSLHVFYVNSAGDKAEQIQIPTAHQALTTKARSKKSARAKE